MGQIATTLRIEEELKEELEKLCLEEQRSLNNLINWILWKYIEEHKKNSTSN